MLNNKNILPKIFYQLEFYNNREFLYILYILIKDIKKDFPTTLKNIYIFLISIEFCMVIIQL